MEVEYDMATSFGFTFGGGIVLTDKISVGIRYYSLGKPEFDGTFTTTVDGESFKEKDKYEQSISVLLLTVDYTL